MVRSSRGRHTAGAMDERAPCSTAGGLDALNIEVVASFDARTIDAALVAGLVEEQFPHWAHLPVQPVPAQGNDNRSFRLGEDLLVRLPSAAGYVPQVAKEQRWLPYLQRHLPVPVPVPVATGLASASYPFPWSVLCWLDGVTALALPPEDQELLARDLAEFLTALQQIDAGAGPLAGEHSFHRGQHPSVYDADVQRCLPLLAQRADLDVRRLERRWDAALATHWPGPPVWFHGDLAAGNVLVADGRVTAVIDFGCCGVGDPACDVAAAWTMLEPTSRDRFRDITGLDDGTWERGRAWALWKAAITVIDGPEDQTRHALRVLRTVAVTA